MEDNTVALGVQGIYLATLGRAADPAGRAFLEPLTDEVPVRDLVAAFLASEEFAESFAATGPEAFVRSLYFNLFDRNGDVGGVEFWTGLIEDGAIAMADLPTLMFESASDIDLEAYRAKTSIAEYVTDEAEAGRTVPFDDLTFADFTRNAELVEIVTGLDAARDTLSSEVLGTSLGGRPILAATVGTGATEVMLITQIHGDEPTGTEGALYLLDWLSGDSPEAAAVREEVTLTVVPRVNPDGFDRWFTETGGERGVLDPRLNEAGEDLNRQFDPAEPPEPGTAPEADLVIALHDRIQPDLLLDYHNQNLYRDEDGTIDTISVLWATAEGVDGAVVDTGKQAALAIREAVDTLEFSDLTLFPGSETPSFVRNGFALEGTPTLLIEQRYLEEMFERAQGLDVDHSALVSAQALEAYVSMRGIVETLANGSFDAYDPAAADAIPPRSEAIDYADLYSDDAYIPEPDMMV